GFRMTALEVRELRTSFHTRRGIVRAVDGVSFSLERGERLAIVGESGSGKSVTALSIMRLVRPPGRIDSGDVLVQGRSVLALGERELQALRGSEVAMIFQDPLTSLNPVHTIGKQIVEAIRLHRDVSRAAARREAVELLRAVQIPHADGRLDDYPHQFSGGMRQRVMIAAALANDPAVLIADEPTTALDVTTQTQILELLDELCAAHGTAVLLITHDLGMVAGFCDRTLVMYGGRVMETGTTSALFHRPLHPYTIGLLESLPPADADVVELTPIPGEPPDPRRLPPGCVFQTRCRFRGELSERERPALREVEPGHLAACHYAEQVRAAVTV
ncbi:MAG TPA: ABC transporter ATP-binding protein, partial [Gaiellaceae bacterium]